MEKQYTINLPEKNQSLLNILKILQKHPIQNI